MVQSRYCGNNLETNAGGQAEMFRNVVRGDTRIFSPLAVARLCVTIGRYWYLFNRLTAVSAGRFYRFEHIDTYSSGKVVAKSALFLRSFARRTLECRYCSSFQGFLFLEKNIQR